MQHNSAKSEKTDISPEEVWNAIVRVTDAVGSNEARALRVLLYLTIIGVIGNEDTLPVRLKTYARSLRRIPFPGGKPLAAAAKGLPLFAFLYDTPANTNNLLPVWQAAGKRGWRSNVLTGERVDLAKKGLPGESPSASVTELLGMSSTQGRLAALRGAGGHFQAVLEEIGRVAPQWTPIIQRNRTSLIAELALAMIGTSGLTRLYEMWEPSCVVTTANLWPFDCALFVEAERLGIPAFIIQHGVTNHYWWPFVGEKMLLWGKMFEDEIRALGAPAGQLAVCGMPAADAIFLRYHGKTGRQSATPASSFVILSQPQALDTYAELFANYKALLIAVVAATPEINWKVKLHQIEDESFYRDMLDGRFPNFSILPKSTTLEAAVTQADVACTLFSTAGLEAMIMRRPLVVFDVAPVIYDYAWWPKHGGGTYVSTAHAMLDYIKRASSNAQFAAGLVAEQDEFLARNFANHGRAADAILDTVEECVKAKAGTSGHYRLEAARRP